MTRPSPSAPLSGCPRRETLVDFLRGRLSEAELESVAAHLDTCPDCASVVSQLDAAETPDSVHERVRQALASPPVAAEAATTAGTVAAAGATPAVADEVGFEEEQRVGGYRLLERLGGGGAGVVYRAEQVAVGRPVAVKLLHAVADAGDRERFRREAAALARVRHRHAVGLLDYGEHDGVPYLVLELAEGGTLADRLAGGPLDPREAAGLVRDVAGAVAAAHRAGVLHRDLKPDNVLLDTDDCAKVADFGLARLLDTDTSALTASGAVVGTPEYLSPEQAGGEAATTATDVWGLGAVLCACLTGRPPIEGANTLEALAAARGGKVAPLAGVPRGLAAVCLKCLAKRPVDRYPTADGLADDLDRWLRGERPRAQRRRWRRWVVGLAAVAVVGGLAAAMFTKPAAQATDDRVLEVERSYKEGVPQVLLGATGKPVRMRQLTGRPVPPDAPLAADGSFAVEAVDSQCLFELLPDPGHDAYRLVAQIRHQRSDPIGMVGLYIGRTEHPRQPTLAHAFLRVLFNEVRSLNDSPILIPRLQNRPAVNYAQLGYKLLSDDQHPNNVDASVHIRSGCPFTPAGSGRGDWRELAVTVIPGGMIVQLGQVRYGVSRQAMQDALNLAMKSNIMKRFVATEGSVPHPTFHPRGGLGLYLSSGAACFRNVRLVPLMSSESHE